MADIEQKIVLRAVDRTSGELARVKQGMKAIDDENKNLVTSFRGVSSGVGVAMGAFTALGGYMTGAFVRSLIDVQLNLNKVDRSLKVAVGSAEGAKRETQFLRDESERLGLEFQSVALSYGKLSAATRNSALTTKQTREIFLATAEAGSALGLSAYEVEGALNAMQQMVSKGNVSAEELRGQLGERIPGAFAMAAKSIGVTEQELGKMLEQGKLLASDLLPKLAGEMRKTFGSGAVEGAKSLQGEINKLKNGWLGLQSAFLSSGGSDLITKTFSGLNSIVKSLNAEFQALRGGVDISTDSTKKMSETLKQIQKTKREMDEAQKSGGGFLGLAGVKEQNELNRLLKEYNSLAGKGQGQKFIQKNVEEQNRYIQALEKTSVKHKEIDDIQAKAEEKRKASLKTVSTSGGKDISSSIVAQKEREREEILRLEQERIDDERMVDDFILETNRKFYSEQEKLRKQDSNSIKKKGKEDIKTDLEILKEKTNNSAQITGTLLQAGQTLFQGNKKFAVLNKALALGEITVNTAKAVVSALPNIPLSIAMGVLGGAQFAKAASVKYAAKGADFITNGPQLMMVGENAGGKERVQVTPLSSPNIDGPKNSSSNVSFGNINIVVNNGNDFANMLRNNPDEFNALMKEGLKRGALKGIV
jgi:tape measure domain-containing protein